MCNAVAEKRILRVGGKEVIMEPSIISDIYIIPNDTTLITARFVIENGHRAITSISLGSLTIPIDNTSNDITVPLGKANEIKNKHLIISSTIEKTNVSSIHCNLYLNGGLNPKHRESHSNKVDDHCSVDITLF